MTWQVRRIHCVSLGECGDIVMPCHSGSRQPMQQHQCRPVAGSHIVDSTDAFERNEVVGYRESLLPSLRMGFALMLAGPGASEDPCDWLKTLLRSISLRALRGGGTLRPLPCGLGGGNCIAL